MGEKSQRTNKKPAKASAPGFGDGGGWEETDEKKDKDVALTREQQQEEAHDRHYVPPPKVRPHIPSLKPGALTPSPRPHATPGPPSRRSSMTLLQCMASKPETRNPKL